ncbi:translation initiation factor eIF-2B subunit alpha [Tremella mesenterica]|uniref:Translation initiation factor eIF2B subunit alpha n=1 Tax=Tremella mesenterica TaxID=5217 RepID=A0A4Q1BTM8_TREME|nr:translation initiation factor eIF-2B subunit alpha [Tremella mesenterica]
MASLSSSPYISSSTLSGPSIPRPRSAVLSSPRGFDVVQAYNRALEDDQIPHPIAAILALVELMETSTASTISGLATELMHARQTLIETQASLGVRAGCQLWERFFALSAGSEEFPAYKRSLITQGRSFCLITAPQCREKIANLAVGFIKDDCTILTHSYSRPVVQTILRAHRQNRRLKVYVTEARPACTGLRTHQILTAAGVPCTVVLDSAVAYIMERVDMVMVGSEAVVESGGLVSAVGTYQIALVAKSMQKPFYALAESYKFLRHYPLSQTDLPIPRLASAEVQTPLSFPSSFPISQPVRPHTPLSQISPIKQGHPVSNEHITTKEGDGFDESDTRRKDEKNVLRMSEEMIAMNPKVDVTTPDLIDFIITDLGAPLSPTSVSQYLVAQFSS